MVKTQSTKSGKCASKGSMPGEEDINGNVPSKATPAGNSGHALHAMARTLRSALATEGRHMESKGLAEVSCPSRPR